MKPPPLLKYRLERTVRDRNESRDSFWVTRFHQESQDRDVGNVQLIKRQI
jgi:hypothetical protein